MGFVLTETPAENVGLIRLNRPERRNALSTELRRDIAAAITAFRDDPEIRCIVITGDDAAFAAGADLAELAEVGPGDEVFDRITVVRQALEACPMPVIAAVRGLALGGGCEMAMMCDILIAGQSARFGQPEVRVGIMPGAGGTQRLLRSAGRAKAMRWLLTGDLFDAVTAESLGLVSEVVPDDEVLGTAIDMAANIAKLPARAVATIKEAVRLGEEAPLASALAFENRAFRMLFATADQKEGMHAFLEKRPAKFSHR